MPRRRGWAILDEDVLVLHQRRCCSLWLWIALKFHMDQSCPQGMSTIYHETMRVSDVLCK